MKNHIMQPSAGSSLFEKIRVKESSVSGTV